MVTGIGQWRARLTTTGPAKRYMAPDELSASVTTMWGVRPCGPVAATLPEQPQCVMVSGCKARGGGWKDGPHAH